jgi:hypothetical protein
MYRRLYRLGRPLAGERTRAETAYEYMQKLIDGIEALRVKRSSHFAGLLSGARQDVEFLTDLYHDALFSHSSVQKNEVRKALNVWKHLRLRLSIARVNFLVRKRFKHSSSQ